MTDHPYVPAIAEPEPITVSGGRLDGARVRMVDTSQAMVTVVIYRHPETGDVVTNLRATVSRADVLHLLEELTATMQGADDD